MRKYTLEWYLSIRRMAPKSEIADWTVKNVMTNYFLFDVAADKKHRIGVCTACGERIRPDKAPKGKYILCPQCGARIKATERAEMTGDFQNYFVGYLENYGEFLLHRIFRVARELWPNGKQEAHIEEAQMEVLGLPLKQRYTYSMVFSRETRYKNDNGFTRYAVTKGGSHAEYWERGTIGGYGCNVFQLTRQTYPYNLKTELKGTPFEYSQLWELAESGEKFNLYNALMGYLHTPQLEYLIKLKLYRLAAGYIRYGLYCNHNENNVIRFLGLKSYRELKFAIEQNMSVGEFEAYRELLKKNIPYTEKNVKIYRAMKWHGDRIEGIEKVISIEGLYDYYKAQADRRNVSFRTFIGDYADHLRDCETLRLDISDTMYAKPKNFYDLHTRLSAEVTALQNKEKYERCDKRLAMEEHYGYTSGELAVIVPKKAEEIVVEGKIQGHCVGSYIDRVTDGNSVIVFVRKTSAPTVSYYTMEVDPKTMTVVQCRGYKNGVMTPEVKAFVEEYKSKCLAKLKKKAIKIKAEQPIYVPVAV
ncbi:MAG: PcfJ domain-containing protein [Christensenellaceae bacterium]